MGTRRRRHHADEPQHLRPVFEPQIVEIAQALHDAVRVFLLRRGELQRHRGQGAGQGDLGVDAMHINLHKTFLDAPRRRRAGLRPGRALPPGSSAPYPRRCPSWRPAEGGLGPRRARGGGGGRRRPFRPQSTRLPRPDGHVLARAQPTMLSHGSDGHEAGVETRCSTRTTSAAGLVDLMTCPFRDHPSMHEVLFENDEWAQGHGDLSPRFRQGDDRRGLATTMTSTSTPRVHGAMHDRDRRKARRQGLARPVISGLCATSPWRGEGAGKPTRFSGAPYVAQRRRLERDPRGRPSRLTALDAAEKPGA